MNLPGAEPAFCYLGIVVKNITYCRAPPSPPGCSCARILIGLIAADHFRLSANSPDARWHRLKHQSSAMITSAHILRMLQNRLWGTDRYSESGCIPELRWKPSDFLPSEGDFSVGQILTDLKITFDKVLSFLCGVHLHHFADGESSFT